VTAAAFAASVVARWRRRRLLRLRSLDFVPRRALRRFDLSRRTIVNLALHDHRSLLQRFASTTTIAAIRSHGDATRRGGADRNVTQTASVPTPPGALLPRRANDGIRLATSAPPIGRTVVRRDAGRSTIAGGARMAAALEPSTRGTDSAPIAAHRTSVSPLSTRERLSPLRVRRFGIAEAPIAGRRVPSGSHAPMASSPLPTTTADVPTRTDARMPALDLALRRGAAVERAASGTPARTTRVRQVSYRVDRSTSIVHRATRIERAAAPVAFDRPRLEPPGRSAPAADRGHGAAQSGEPTRSVRAAGGFDLAEIERAIAARVDERIDRKISAGLKASLQSEADLSRTMTDRVYDALYDRMILEKERRG
jgi:hypothetical protein